MTLSAEIAPELHRPTCRSCTAYRLHSNMVGMRPAEKRLSLEMGCDKNMPAVKWLGPCPFYDREPGSDDA